MIASDFYIEPASWDVDEPELKAIRREVFIEEQGVTEGEEYDKADASCIHVMAKEQGGQVIGTGRLTPEGKIGRMAVRSDWRGKGVGAALLRHLLEEAQARGFDEVKLAAQTHAIPFYENQGFEAYGDVFLDARIEHRWMRKDIPPAEERQAPIEYREPSDPEGKRVFSNRHEYREQLIELIGAARTRVSIFTRDLEPHVLGDPAVIEAFRTLATTSPAIQIRIVVVDTTRAVKDGHLLLELAQRLSSVFHFRRPHPDQARRADAFTVIDRRHALYRELASVYEGFAMRRDTQFAEAYAEEFTDLWEYGTVASDLRRLSL